MLGELRRGNISLSLWELCSGSSFLGIRKDMGRRAQGMDITPWGSIDREL